MLKFAKKIVFCILICCILVFAGCSKTDDDIGDEESNSEEGFAIYYLKSNGMGLVYDYVDIEENDKKIVVGRLIETMMNPKEKFETAINEYVKIVDYSITDNVLNINFSLDYSMQDKMEELLCRAAFVMTLTQIDGIEYVNMTVNSQPLKVNDTAVALMKADDFADISADSSLTERKITIELYFANETLDKLKIQKREVSYGNNKSLERVIVDELINGPNETGYERTLKEDVNIVEVFTTNRICYVYLDKAINQMIGIDGELMIYSIVNSLCGLDYIDMVQIVIEGDTSAMFNDKYSIAEPFKHNQDIVQREEN